MRPEAWLVLLQRAGEVRAQRELLESVGQMGFCLFVGLFFVEGEWSWLDSEYGGSEEYWAFRKLCIFGTKAIDSSSSLRRKG